MIRPRTYQDYDERWCCLGEDSLRYVCTFAHHDRNHQYLCAAHNHTVQFCLEGLFENIFILVGYIFANGSTWTFFAIASYFTPLITSLLFNPWSSSEVHRSLWSNLVRIWDRSTEIPLPKSAEHRESILRDPGTCSRTDLIYAGRRSAVEDKIRWLQAREKLYAKHADTAVGPGSVELTSNFDRPVSLVAAPISINTNTIDRPTPSRPQGTDVRTIEPMLVGYWCIWLTCC